MFWEKNKIDTSCNFVYTDYDCVPYTDENFAEVLILIALTIFYNNFNKNFTFDKNFYNKLDLLKCLH